MAANEVSGTKLEELELFYEELRQANGHPLWVRVWLPSSSSLGLGCPTSGTDIWRENTAGSPTWVSYSTRLPISC